MSPRVVDRGLRRIDRGGDERGVPGAGVAQEISVGVVYAVVLSMCVLGVVTEVLSAVAIGFFYLPPSVGFVVSDPQGAAAPAIVLAVAAVICSVAIDTRGEGERS